MSVARIENKGRVAFHCHVEETLESALEIAAWMFDSSCKQIRLDDAPAVDCEALRNLKLLLVRASSRDHIVREAQRLGGADATITESKTITIGIVSTANQDAHLERNGSGGEGKNDTVAVSIASPVSGATEWPGFDGGRP